MIPPGWTPVHRADGEQVGWLAPDGAAGRVVPRLLTGTPLADARKAADAAALLRAEGLAALDRRWWARLPGEPLTGVVDAGKPAEDWSWQSVVLVESSPAGCTVRPEWPAPGETGRASLPVPVGDLLLAEPPS
ncbi:hypothetical protein [Candidatus Blastococcus massiliensis]|uniref:hypothetical protein n=1 Tax=Candidatus Blastococcus massiliensis TaxID=1470358 RepID=UPI0012DCF9D6|nr:hypothetical protein [Candidatus Blastococcus massiliensis]